MNEEIKTTSFKISYYLYSRCESTLPAKLFKALLDLRFLNTRAARVANFLEVTFLAISYHTSFLFYYNLHA